MKKQSEDNKSIAKFMGYIYYEPLVLIDYSNCGGVYTEHEIFSKVPIEVIRYEKQVYFNDVENPDYNKAGGTWRSDYRLISWDSLNRENFIMELKYDISWDAIIEVCRKCKDIVLIENLTCLDFYFKEINNCLLEYDLEKVYNSVIKFIKSYENRGNKN